MEHTTFESLALGPKILSALNDAGYETPTEIQAAAIPIALDGRDVMATAQTGTGKTAAFTLPILHQMMVSLNSKNRKENQEDTPDKHRPRLQALILSPTRELAHQIEENLKTYGKELPFTTTAVVGGLPIKKQIKALQGGVDILVATPGRLLDLLNRKVLDLRQVKYFVLDEADRMLDMGFIYDVSEIAKKVNRNRQTLLFSATTSPEILQLSSVLLNKPERVSISPPQSVAEAIEQKVLLVDAKNKRKLLAELMKNPELERVLVFTMTKSNANVVASVLTREGIAADAIHSDKNQRARQEALSSFEKGEIRALIATDVMARGIDVDNITHVINFELSKDPENFVHRIGRTARAGTSGKAISFCDHTEVDSLKSIESFIEEEIEVDTSHAYHSPFVQTMKSQRTSPFAKKRRR